MQICCPLLTELCFVDAVIGDVKVTFLLDSGAGSTIIGEKIWKVVRRNEEGLEPVLFLIR